MRMAAAALALALALTAGAQTFLVSGRVVDSETGAPLNRTRMCLSGESLGERCVITSGDGRFSFDAPQGEYSLVAAHRDWGDVYGEPAPGSDLGSAVVTGPNHDTTQLLFRFRGPVAIYGRILDQGGEPIPSATVEVFRQEIVAGRKRLTSVGRPETDDFGEYRLSSIPAGVYYLAATGEPWYTLWPPLFDAYAELMASGTPPVPYETLYYPGVTDARAASPVLIRPGTQLHADFHLRPAVGATIRPACSESLECESDRFVLYAPGPGVAETLIRTCADGCHDGFRAVPPGRYFLRRDGFTETPVRVDVNGSDLTVAPNPKPASTMCGNVSFRDPLQRPRHTLYANVEDDDTGKIETVVVTPDGRVSFPPISAGRVRLFLSGTDGFFIAEMSVEGAPVRDGVIELTGGAVQVHLLASGETGRLDGILNENGKPVPGALVVLAPSGACSDPHRYLATQSGSDGSFEFPHAPAGDYAVFAVKNIGFEYAERDAVAPYLSKAKRVRIRARDTATESLELASTGN